MGAFDDIVQSAPGVTGGVTFAPEKPKEKKSTRPTGAFDDLIAEHKAEAGKPHLMDAIGRSIANAATFGLADRAAALGEAATGLGGEFGAYSKNLAREQELTKAAEEAHPIASTIGTIGGAIINPINRFLPGVSGATLPEKIKSGMVSGAALGGLYGAGESKDLTNLRDVAQNVGEGVIGGGVIGGVAPPVIEGLARGGGFAARAAGIPQAMGAAVNPESAAMSQIGEALLQDRGTREAMLARRAALGEMPSRRETVGLGMTPQQAGTAIDSGIPVVTADMGGEATRRLARTAANISPEADAMLRSETNYRHDTRVGRIADRLVGLGGGNSPQTLERLQAEARRRNRPNYERAYAEGENGVWSPDLAQLAEAPAVQSAIRDATRIGANRAAAEGFKPVTNPFVADSEGNLHLRLRPDGSIATPSLQFWDHVKQGLDSAIDKARRAGDNGEVRTITGLKNALVRQLDVAAPSYAHARGIASAAFGAEDALQAGVNFVRAKGENHQYSRAIGRFSAPERELFAHGFMSEIERQLAESREGATATINRIFETPAARERIEMAVGRDRARRLEMHLYAESVVDQLRNAVTGNSTTARQIGDVIRHGGALGAGLHLGTILASFINHGVRGLDERVMQRVAYGLLSRDMKTYDRAIKTVQNNRALSTVFKNGLTNATLRAILAEINQRKGDGEFGR
jgi:hypothetical protein